MFIVFYNRHNRKNYALICAKLTINIIVGRLWDRQTKVLCRARVKCFAFNFSFTPCTCTSFLSLPCRCISLYHHCKAFYFRFIFTFIFVIISFNLHWSVSAKPPLPCCGVDIYRYLFRLKFYLCFSNIIAYKSCL